MAEIDHVHEIGKRDTSFEARLGGEPNYFCSGCELVDVLTWWYGYRKAIANVQANGLPDHQNRLEFACDNTWDGVTPSLALVRRIVWDYLTWTKVEVGS